MQMTFACNGEKQTIISSCELMIVSTAFIHSSVLHGPTLEIS